MIKTIPISPLISLSRQLIDKLERGIRLEISLITQPSPNLALNCVALGFIRFLNTTLQNKENRVLQSLRLWVCSGETLPVSLAEQFFAAFQNDNKILANFYGSTEIMGDVTYHLLSNSNQLQSAEKVPIGKNQHRYSLLFNRNSNVDEIIIEKAT